MVVIGKNSEIKILLHLFLQLSVAEFIWGYEDELACLDSNPGEESEYYDEEEYNDPFRYEARLKKI